MRRTFQLLFGTLLLILIGSPEAKALLSQNHAGDEWRSTPKTRVMGYADNASGRPSFCPQLRLQLAMGYRDGGDETASGRRTFLSADPLGNASSMSLYDYCNGDPVNGLDPDGRFGKGAIDGMEGNIAAGDPNSGAFNAGFDVGNFISSLSAGSQTFGNEITAPVNPFTYINAAENFSGAVGNAQPFFAQADGGSGLESYSSAIAYTALYDAPIAGPIFKGLDSTYYDPYGNSLVTQTTTQQGLNIALGLSEYATFALAPGAGATAAEGGINYGALDSLGRPTGVSATITEDMIGTGTSANPSIIPPGWSGNGTLFNEARGHLLGNQLGGSGDIAENLVTLQQNPVNSPVMRGFENQVRAAVEGGQTVNYSVTPIYNGSNLVPRGITIMGTGSDGFNLGVSVLNPIGR